MNRGYQVTFCKRCQHREMNFNHGLLCGLTHEKADFEESCPSFTLDTSVKETPKSEASTLSATEIEMQVSPEGFAKLKHDQNLGLGISVGIIAGLFGASIWCIISVTTGFQIGYLAIGIGALVGFAIRETGKGIEPYFGYWGAGISFLSVLLGNVLVVIGIVAQQTEMSIIEVLRYIDITMIPSAVVETTGFLSVVFMLLALVAGYRFSFRKVTDKDVANINAVPNQ